MLFFGLVKTFVVKINAKMGHFAKIGSQMLMIIVDRVLMLHSLKFEDL